MKGIYEIEHMYLLGPYAYRWPEHIDQYTYTGVMLIFILLLTGFGGFTTYAIYIRSHWLPSSCKRSALQPIEDEYINSETKRI